MSEYDPSRRSSSTLRRTHTMSFTTMYGTVGIRTANVAKGNIQYRYLTWEVPESSTFGTEKPFLRLAHSSDSTSLPGLTLSLARTAAVKTSH